MRLIEARNQRGWSQQEVADQLGTTSVNVSRWERGITKPNPYFRRKLCKLFGRNEQDLDLLPSTEPLDPASPVSQVAATPTAPTTSAASPASPVREEDARVYYDALYDPAIPLPPAIRLVGRDADIAHLKGRLRRGGSIALTALNGLPGVGKTALAIALAHDAELRGHFRDGVLWAALGPNPNVSGLLSRWGALLGISSSEIGVVAGAGLSANEAWARALRNAIASRRMLIVIDDAWQVEEALTFKVGGPNCAHLVTTRFPGIASHIAFDGATTIQELSEEQSMALLRMLAPDVVELETKRAADLVHAVGGLPLALTLMGNYLRKQGYTGQARRITAALERLTDAAERLHISEPHGPVESHPSLTGDIMLSLQTVLAVTDQQLPQDARAALYALSVFPPKPNSFSEEAALAIAACPVDVLDTLTDAGILETSGSERYTLHQVIADFARLHLTEQAAAAAHERLIAYVTAYVEAHRKDYELLEQESTTILAALEAAHALNKQPELVRGVVAFAPFLLLRALYALAEQHLRRAHAAATALDDKRGLINVLLYQGETAQQQGNYEQAEAAYQEGLSLARQIADKERISALLNNLGWVTWKQGGYTQAETYLQEGLTIAREIDDKERISGLLKVLSSVVGSRGDYSQEEAYLQEGLTIARQIGNREQICSLLINLGASAGDQGNHAKAESYFREGLVMARQIGQREQISLLLANIGEALGAQENYGEAAAYFQEGLELARQIGHREWISLILLNLGLMTREQRNYAQAETYFQESLTVARQIGMLQIIGNGLYEYGKLHLVQQQIDAAERTFREMLATIPEGDQDLLALAHYGLARVAAAHSNMEEAYRLGEESITALEAMGHRNAQEVRQWLDSIRV